LGKFCSYQRLKTVYTETICLVKKNQVNPPIKTKPKPIHIIIRIPFCHTLPEVTPLPLSTLLVDRIHNLTIFLQPRISILCNRDPEDTIGHGVKAPCAVYCGGGYVLVGLLKNCRVLTTKTVEDGTGRATAYSRREIITAVSRNGSTVIVLHGQVRGCYNALVLVSDLIFRLQYDRRTLRNRLVPKLPLFLIPRNTIPPVPADSPLIVTLVFSSPS
jgi:hypothetical protein